MRGPIQTLPRTTVDEEDYQKSVKRLQKKAEQQAIKHDEKLESKIFRLKMRVKELGAELEEEERNKAKEEARKNTMEKLEMDQAPESKKGRRG